MEPPVVYKKVLTDADPVEMSRIPGLAEALAAKAPLIHTHPSADPDVWLNLPTDVSVQTTAYGIVTGLVFNAAANTNYYVQLLGAFQAAAATTGIALALDIPSGAVVGAVDAQLAATSSSRIGQTADATAQSVTTGVPTAAANHPLSGWWIVNIGATAGPVQLLMRSEVAASPVTLKANLSRLIYRTI